MNYKIIVLAFGAVISTTECMWQKQENGTYKLNSERMNVVATNKQKFIQIDLDESHSIIHYKDNLMECFSKTKLNAEIKTNLKNLVNDFKNFLENEGKNNNN